MLYKPKKQQKAEPETEPTAKNSREKVTKNPLYAQAEEIISYLNKRQSRQMCKPLGIQQKCGGVEKTLTFIKAEIRSLFKDDPERVIAVIEKKLPELICPSPEASESDERIAS